ncbi:MAG: SEC-C metal-binding domain-containing protein, partial [Desulforhopalus sp.]
MAKIGRNEKCPCRSGKKYKHCCALKEQRVPPPLSPEQALKITLMSGVKEIQKDAEGRKVMFRELGVFFFFSSAGGDAWLMEMTECDCVQVAKDGEPLEAPIDENSETIEINWSHTFAIRNKQIEITAYADKSVEVLSDGPGRELNAAMNRIRKKFSKEEL